MINRITLLLLIGLVVWGCEEDASLPYLNVSYINMQRAANYSPQCLSINESATNEDGYNCTNAIWIHYYKDDNYIEYSYKTSGAGVIYDNRTWDLNDFTVLSYEEK